MRHLSRAIAVLAVLAPLPAACARAFGLGDVTAKAQRLAKEPLHDPKDAVPEWLLKISDDQWRDIRFRPERALWADRRSPFRVQFFHPGLLYDGQGRGHAHRDVVVRRRAMRRGAV